MLAVLSITIPFFAVIVCGYAAERFGLLGEAGRAGINSFVFYFSLPVLLFSLMATTDVSDRFDWIFVGAYLGVSLVLFAAVLVTVRAVFGLSASEGALAALSGVYGNVGYIGIPLVVVMFGQAQVIPVILCLVMDLIIMIPLAILLIELQGGSDARLGNVFGKTSRALLTNPIIVSIALGILASLSGVKLPAVAMDFTTLLGSAAAPCALFALGSSLVGRKIAGAVAETGFVTVVKLVVHPVAVWIAMFHVFTIDPDWAWAAVIASTMPVAATVFVLAQQYETYVARSSSAILVSTVISVVTVTACLVYLQP